MFILLAILAPVLAAAALSVNLFLLVRSRERIATMQRSIIRWLLSRVETVELWKAPTAGPHPGKTPLGTWAYSLWTTRAGIWAVLASLGFLALWIGGWVSPRYPLGFLSHFLGAWALAAALAAMALFLTVSVAGGLRSLRIENIAGRMGLRRIWTARPGCARGRFQGALQEAIGGCPRIEVLDFTGHELIAKGPGEEGGVLATIIARHSAAEVRLLLFNPCARDIDPDRKQTTVVESQLSAMEMSREAFDQKIQATLNRLELLNRGRPKPIEVRLYAEKPTFRAILAGETAYIGALDPRDGSGQISLYEVLRHSDGPSLFPAVKAHFARVWADSMALEVEATALVGAPAGPLGEDPGPDAAA